MAEASELCDVFLGILGVDFFSLHHGHASGIAWHCHGIAALPESASMNLFLVICYAPFLVRGPR